MSTKILDKLNPELLMKCYSKVTKSNNMHEHFKKMEFNSSNNEERVRIYRVYISLMLPKCMTEKGHQQLPDWRGATGGRLKTAGGNCN